MVALAIPLVPALGLLVQQQFAPLAMPDPTRGWRDRFGPEISLCMSREIAGNGDCVIEATQAAAADPLPADTSTFPFTIGKGSADIENQNPRPNPDTQGLQN